MTALVGCLRRADHTVHHSASSYFTAATAADRAVLARVAPPVLDVGCGPGRHVAALAEEGTLALGIDITPSAVALARRRGALVLERSVFARVPGGGRWATALLLDGNLGIGGDPVTLLQRVFALLRRDGTVVVETSAHRAGSTEEVRFEIDGVAGPPFTWSAIGMMDLPAIVARAGCRIRESWRADARDFAVLDRD